MAELKELYDRLGFRSVRTYLQSGNVVFVDGTKGSNQATIIQAAIKHEFGHNIAVLVIPVARFTQLVDSNPFINKNEFDVSYMHLTFPFTSPNWDRLKGALPTSTKEAVEFRNGHIYLYCPNGYGHTKVTNNYFEKTFRILATTRNWKTVEALKALATEE